METVVGLFEDFEDADHAVESLIEAGFDKENVSVIVQKDVVNDVATDFVDEHVDSGDIGRRAGEGAVGGGTIGGILGLLVGVGAITIPGLGQAFAAGSIATTIGMAAGGAGVGAAAGALVGAMLGLGMEEEEARAYAEAVKRGGIVVLAEVERSRAEEAREIFAAANVVDIEELRQTWKEDEGWTKLNQASQSEDKSSLD